MNRNHILWRCKESLDLIGDVLFADEMNDEELRKLYEGLCHVLIRNKIPDWLAPGRRAVTGRSIIAEYRKMLKKQRIAEIKKGDFYV